MKIKLAAFLLSVGFSCVATADVRMPAVFQDHMILQQGVGASIWGSADAGEEIVIDFAGQTAKTRADAKGRWQVTLKPLKASREARTLTAKGKNTLAIKDVLVGEVWLATGQSNMVSGLKQVPGDEKAVFRAAKDNRFVRAFIGTHWYLCSEQALHTSAVGFFFARKLQEQLDVPVAYIVVARCGSRIEPFIPADEFKAAGLTDRRKSQSKIYDSAIAPLTRYAIKGAIWYQGESNRGSTNYFECVRALRAGWARAFRLPKMPFYMVLVAPFDYSRKGVKSSLLCDTIWAAQYRAAKEIPGVGVVAIHDTDVNIRGIHPRRKKPVGERLAGLALKNQYGKNIVTAGPRFAGATLADKKVVVRFSGIDQGLCTKDGKAPTCFELSEDGETFVGATASIKGDRVEVHCETITAPKYVRMGWFDTATPTLRDKNGLPVFCFSARKMNGSAE